MSYQIIYHQDYILQKMDSYDRPWMPDTLVNPKPKSKKGQSIAVPIQGEIPRCV